VLNAQLGGIDSNQDASYQQSIKKSSTGALYACPAKGQIPCGGI
jgi:hypothetical protein